MNTTTIGARIFILMKDGSRLNKTKFASEIGVPPSTLKSLRPEQEGVTSSIIAGIRKAYPKISMDWLLFGEGEMFLEDAPKKIINGENSTINTHSGNGDIAVVKQVHAQELSSDCTEQIHLRDMEISFLKKENDMLRQTIGDKQQIINLLQKK